MSRVSRAILLGFGLTFACHRDAPVASLEAGPAPAPSDAEAVVARPVTLPPRCQPSGVGLAIADARGVDDLEIGDAVVLPDGLAVDLVHHTSAGRVAAVASLPGGAWDGGSPRVSDLAPTLGDAPPPRVVARGADRVAVAYIVSKRRDARELGVFTIATSGDVKAAGTVPESRDDSLAFDIAPTFVVWDEARPGTTPRGVIRAADLGADAHPGAPHDVSPVDSDAELPRVAPLTGGGALVFWLARRPESVATTDAAPAEITGEARAYSWLEVVAVDARGLPAAAPRRLTSLSGHVSAYDVQPLSAAGSRSDVLVVARDDGEAVDGSGGALLRVRVRADGQDPPLALATDGLGRGAPTFVDGSPPWVSWVATNEEGRLLALDASGVPAQLPSVEPALDEGRALAWIDPGRRLLAAMPGDAAAQLRVLACGP